MSKARRDCVALARVGNAILGAALAGNALPENFDITTSDAVASSALEYNFSVTDFLHPFIIITENLIGELPHLLDINEIDIPSGDDAYEKHKEALQESLPQIMGQEAYEQFLPPTVAALDKVHNKLTDGYSLESTVRYFYRTLYAIPQGMFAQGYDFANVAHACTQALTEVIQEARPNQTHNIERFARIIERQAFNAGIAVGLGTTALSCFRGGKLPKAAKPSRNGKKAIRASSSKQRSSTPTSRTTPSSSSNDTTPSLPTPSAKTFNNMKNIWMCVFL